MTNIKLGTSLLVLLVIFSACSLSSGNQHDDVNVDKAATERMEAQMLRMLGLSKRPRPKGNATAPQFMWDMYNLMNQHASEQGTDLDKAKTTDCVFLDPTIPGNIVRSFSCKVRRYRSQMKASYQTDWVLDFNLSSISRSEKLTKAHLRLESLINLRAKTLAEYFQLTISSYIGPNMTTLQKNNILFKHIVNNQSDSSEVAVDVLTLIQHWRRHLGDTHTIFVSIECLPTVRKNDCRQFMSKMRRPVQQSVNLLTISMEGEQCKERTRRSANNNGDTPLKLSSNLCQRHSLYVGFREVGWDDWIIAPTGYQAYYCAGDCVFPIGEQQNGTNHAVIQTLVRRFHYKSVPDVCCAPVRLSPISLLFFDDNDNVVLRRYDDMIVESCGCR